MADISKILKGGFLEGRKTYILCGIAILTAVGAYLTGDLDAAAAIKAIFEAGVGMTIRLAIK